LLFGFVPAWNLSRPSLIADLRAGDNADPSSGSRRLFTRRNLLVVAQISLSLTLLTAAGLFIRGSSRVAGADPGFRVDNRVLVEFDSSLAGYKEVRGRQIYTALLDRLKSMPGVESASFAAAVPFGMVSLGRSVQPSGAPAAKPQDCSGGLNGTASTGASNIVCSRHLPPRTPLVYTKYLRPNAETYFSTE
jgi:hypothetical protein